MMFGPGPHMVYRTIGGILEFFFFPGPTPEEVIQQYHQISRWYYKDLGELKKVVNRIQSHGIPLDVISTDIDVMDRYRDFTFSKVC
uniref:Glycoside hydrolase family 31 TIM barrel domain-containing protein n=1 Tax=Acrobeloides nanus TaxID=290746 RepID=A0A914EH74_9BILA